LTTFNPQKITIVSFVIESAVCYRVIKRKEKTAGNVTRLLTKISFCWWAGLKFIDKCQSLHALV